MRFKKTSFIIITAILLSNLLLIEVSLAGTADTIKEGLGKTAVSATIATEDKLEPPSLAGMVGRAINYMFVVVGIVFITIIAVGGYLWMSATGNEENIKKAKTFILNGVFGLMVIFISYALVSLIFAALKSATGG